MSDVAYCRRCEGSTEMDWVSSVELCCTGCDGLIDLSDPKRGLA